MADNNIIIRLLGEDHTDGVRQALDEQKKKAKGLEDEMARLSDEYVRSERLLKSYALGEGQVAAAMAKVEKSLSDKAKAVKAEQDATKRSIVFLEQNAKAENLLANSTDSARKRLADMRQALMEMEDAGNVGKEYEKLALSAAALTDQYGDMQQRIRILSSDTAELDAAMSVGSGLTGAFNTATSAAALLGGESEELQKAFTKVQAALSILNGVQAIANTLNKDSAAMVVLKAQADKVAEIAARRKAAAEGTFTKAAFKSSAANIKSTVTTIAHTAATKAAAAGQWLLNAAMYANPVGLIVAGFIALAGALALAFSWMSKQSKAERAYADASMELEKVQKANAVTAAKRAHDREQQVRDNTNAENAALDEAKKRHASELEMANIKAAHAKKAAQDTAKYAEDEIKLNNNEVKLLEKMRDAKKDQLDAATEGTRKYKKLQEELAEAEQKYYDAVKKGKDLEQERDDARREAEQAEQEANRQRESMTTKANNTRIELMRDGATKEIMQIQASYKEQLRELRGNSEEEITLRKALEAKQAKEIAAVRKKYALEAQQTAIQEQKNLLQAMASSGGTEADYQAELNLRKEILKAESQAKIDALDKDKMSDERYAAEVKAIRQQLATDIKAIEDGDAQRHEQYLQSIADADVRSSKARAEALTGAEGTQAMLDVWRDYYDARKAQIDTNEQAEIAALERSGLKGKEYEAKLTEIAQKAGEERLALTKEQNENEISIREDATRELQRALTKAEDEVAQSQGSGKLDALQRRFDAEAALYDAQKKVIESKYAQGLILYQDYRDQMLEITRKSNAAEVQLETDKMQAIIEGLSNAIGYMQQISGMAFEAIQNNIQAQMDALDEMYTTDAEEAAKNSNKKLISEKEYEKKKKDLEMKAARYRKQQTMIDIALQTALSIVTTIGQLGATPWGIAASVIAGAMGAAQLAIAAAKPLAQYEKGRKGGKGEYALVGEKGPELMYVPDGASIVPNNKLDKPGTWGQYGVPMLAIPDRPDIDTTGIVTRADGGWKIDYDKLGAAVARNIPPQNAVTVSVDRSGIYVNDGRDTRQYLNTKYQAAWN